MWRRALNESVKFCLSPGIGVGVLRMSDSTAPVPISIESRKRSHVSDIEEPSAKKTDIECDKVRRRKFALLLSYSGQGYLGMQRNPGMKTIEEDLLRALKEAGYINDEAFTTPQTIQFQRAARTDKGVSAARQVISIKLPEHTTIDTINKHLPDQIRVFSIKRTTKGFNSKGACDARTYSYTLPTFSFCVDAKMEESFRVPPEVIDEVKNVLKTFEGTHNFHNFTSRKNPLDPSAHRYIMSFDCSDPFLSKNIEFCTLKVKGQSFMLHQIRKMVGLTLAVVRGHTTVETIVKAWAPTRIDIPVAPGLGLVLEEVHYDRYNKRYGADGIHDPLSWEDVEDKINAFKETFIHSAIVETEIQEKSMLTWIETLPYHSYDVRENGRDNNPQECFDGELDEEEEHIPNGNLESSIKKQEHLS